MSAVDDDDDDDDDDALNVPNPEACFDGDVECPDPDVCFSGSRGSCVSRATGLGPTSDVSPFGAASRPEYHESSGPPRRAALGAGGSSLAALVSVVLKVEFEPLTARGSESRLAAKPPPLRLDSAANESAVTGPAASLMTFRCPVGSVVT